MKHCIGHNLVESFVRIDDVFQTINAETLDAFNELLRAFNGLKN